MLNFKNNFYDNAERITLESKETLVVIIKNMDSKDKQIAELEHLLSIAPLDKKPMIEKELRLLLSGIKAEKEAAYLIDFDYKDSRRTMVLHDLRLEINGRVAQIDHLLIHWTFNVFVLETKNFHSGFKITDNGEFMRWNSFKKTYEGMASPLAQNERHIAVLKDAFNKIDLPSRLGLRISPVFHSFILVAPHARIDRPDQEHFDTSQIVKADTLLKTIDNNFEKKSFLDGVKDLSKVVSSEQIKEVARNIKRLHKPASFNYTSKFGLSDIDLSKKQSSDVTPSSQDSSPSSFPKQRCRKCNSENLSIQYGKYGYYFKCASCDGNMPIKLSCGKSGHKERIRKEGSKFYRECQDCKTSSLLFINPTS